MASPECDILDGGQPVRVVWRLLPRHALAARATDAVTGPARNPNAHAGRRRRNGHKNCPAIPSRASLGGHGTNHATSVDKLTYWYWQVWKQESDTVISLQPFALISKRKDAKPGDRPYSVASDKAYITFASKISMTGGNPGAIVRAELEGAVLIEGPNRLRIDGRNFYFQKGDPNVVYSDDRLRFRADQHFGTAKGMQLELLRDPKTKPDEPISIGGIHKVQLLQDVDMTLVSNSFEQTMTSPSGTQRTAHCCPAKRQGGRPASAGPLPKRRQLHLPTGDARSDL